MRVLFAAVLLAASAMPSLAQSILERDARVPPDMPAKGIEAAVMMIRLNGYQCQTVSAVTRHIWSPGFTVCCQQFRYCFDLNDRGGKWEVKPK